MKQKSILNAKIIALAYLTLSIGIFPFLISAVSPEICCAKISVKVPYETATAKFYFSELPSSSYSYWTGQALAEKGEGLISFNASSVIPSYSSSNGALQESGFNFEIFANTTVGSSSPVENFTGMSLNDWINYTETTAPPSMSEVVIYNVSKPLGVFYDGVVSGVSPWNVFSTSQSDSWAWNSSVSGYSGSALFVKSSHISTEVRNIGVSWTIGPQSFGGSPSPAQGTVSNHYVNVSIPAPLAFSQIPQLVISNFKQDPFLIIIVALIIYGGFAYSSQGSRRKRSAPNGGT